MGDGSEGLPGLEPLAKFLHASVYPEADDVTVTGLDRPSGGASWETFFVTMAVRAGGGTRPERVVIKRAPDFGPMAPYDIIKDVVIWQALESSDVPAPHLLALSLIHI